MSEAELLRAGAKCYREWAALARKNADPSVAEYLTALATECCDDAAALEAAGVRQSTVSAPKSGRLS